MPPLQQAQSVQGRCRRGVEAQLLQVQRQVGQAWLAHCSILMQGPQISALLAAMYKGKTGPADN
ncbi:hypothetical protein D3C85_1474810 [compost metagenome]